MSKARAITKVFRSRPVLEGAGVHLHRAFGYSQVPFFDPFLLLDDFRSGIPAEYLPGFPWHPHRGIETITYMLEGAVEHGDSMGNSGTIERGDVQWMTAGSGIIHQEMPKGDETGRMEGFQLWANLPASSKMIDPRYRDVKSDTIPHLEKGDGVTIRIICGTVDGVSGPVRDIVIDPEYVDIALEADTKYFHPTMKGHTVFAYVIEGEGYFCGEKMPFSYEVEGQNYFDMDAKPILGNRSLVLFGDGERVEVSTEKEGMRFLLVSGKPIREPVAWYGPIVMNTREELRIAFDEFEKETFIKKR
jgi:redox-sensitive bicupin YhaK (pirin superfamily)